MSDGVPARGEARPDGMCEPGLSAGLGRVLAVGCGVAALNVYFPQALSPLVQQGLRVSTSAAALVPTATQLGYAAGIFLLTPLADRVAPRRLIAVLFSFIAVGLLVGAAAPSIGVLVGAGVLVGLTSVVPQVIIPVAVGITPAHRRGAVTGMLMGGLVGGILLARAFGGALGAWLGWRGPYLVAAGVAVVFAVWLGRVAPRVAPGRPTRYATLLLSTVSLLRTEPQLRRSCVYQAALWGAFSGGWTALPLLITGPVYRLGTEAVGLLALVGAGSVISTPLAGRWIDRRGPDRVTLVCVSATLAASAVLLLGGRGGTIGLVALGAGLLLLDMATQSSQTANQTRIFALRPDFRARLNTAYMTCVFVGGTVVSWLSVQAFVHWGWDGACAVMALTSLLALVRHLTRPRPTRNHEDRARPGRPA